jgi:hypothetical protein
MPYLNVRYRRGREAHRVQLGKHGDRPQWQCSHGRPGNVAQHAIADYIWSRFLSLQSAPRARRAADILIAMMWLLRPSREMAFTT